MPGLSARIYQNLGRYPVFSLSADQWQEEGWVYDPETERLLKYYIDRKDQYDRVYSDLNRAECARQVLPSAAPELQDWFAAIDAAP